MFSLPFPSPTIRSVIISHSCINLMLPFRQWCKINVLWKEEGLRQDKAPKEEKGRQEGNFAIMPDAKMSRRGQAFITSSLQPAVPSAATLLIKIQEKSKHFRTWLVSGDVREELEKSCSQRHQTTIPDGRSYQDDLGSPTHGKHFPPRKIVEMIIFNGSLIVKNIWHFLTQFWIIQSFSFFSLRSTIDIVKIKYLGDGNRWHGCGKCTSHGYHNT